MPVFVISNPLSGVGKILIMLGYRAAESTFNGPQDDAVLPCLQLHASHRMRNMGARVLLSDKNFLDCPLIVGVHCFLKT